MAAATAVSCTVSSHFSAETGTSVGCSTASIVVTITWTDGYGAGVSSVSRVTSASKVSCNAHYIHKCTSALVESAEISTVNVVNEAGNRTVWACEVVIARTMPKTPKSVTVAVIVALSEDKGRDGRVLLGDVGLQSLPLIGSIQTHIGELMQSPTTVSTFDASVGVLVGQDD